MSTRNWIEECSAVADAMEAQCATHEGRKAHARDVCDQAKREIAALDAAIGSATI